MSEILERMQLLPLLESYPYPAFIFGRGGSIDPSTPLVSPHHTHTRPNARHLPLLWENPAWAAMSEGKAFEDCLDRIQMNSVQIWLRETERSDGAAEGKENLGVGGGAAVSNQLQPGFRDQLSPKSTEGFFPSFELKQTASASSSIAGSGSPPLMSLRLELEGEIQHLDLIRTIYEFAASVDAHGRREEGQSIVVVQTVPRKKVARSKNGGSSIASHSRQRTSGSIVSVSSASAASKASPFQIQDSKPPAASPSTPSASIFPRDYATTPASRRDSRPSLGQPQHSSQDSIPQRTSRAGSATTTTSVSQRESDGNFESPQGPSSMPQPSQPINNNRRVKPAAVSTIDLFESIDWSTTSLGPKNKWPKWLFLITNIVLNNPSSCCVWLTTDYIMIFNDEYARMAPKGTAAFGRPARENWPPTVMESLTPILQGAWDGGKVVKENDLWLFDYYGPEENGPEKVETYHNFAMWPVRWNGQTLALFNIASETTIPFIRERRNNILFQISERTGLARSRYEYMQSCEEILSTPEAAHDIPYALCYLSDVSQAVVTEIDQLENAKPLDPLPPANSEVTFKLKLAGSVGPGQAKNGVPPEVDIGMPKRLFRKRHFDKNPRGMLASPSVASSSLSGRNSSIRSLPHADILRPIIENDNAEATQWPFKRACLTGEIIHVSDTSGLTKGFEIRAWDSLPTGAVVIPLIEPGKKIPIGVIVLGLNARRPFNEMYHTWLEAARAQWTSSIAAVAAFEEEELRREKDRQLAYAQASFLRSASHELLSPLSLLVSPLADLVESVTDSHSRTLAQIAQRNCDRLQRLVESLLSYSRIQSGQTEPKMRRVPLGGLTTDLANMFRTHPKVLKGLVSLQVNCQRDPDPAETWIDVEFYEKIIANLCSNALKYTPAGDIKVSLRYMSGYVELAVSDSGVGIPHAEQSRVMERFYRVEANGAYAEGSGIGLAMVDELVGLMSGSIDLESCTATESGDGTHGTIFTVTFPLGVEHINPAFVTEDEKIVDGFAIGKAVAEDAAAWSRASLSDETGSESGSADKFLKIDVSTLFFEKTDVLLVVDDNADMRRYIVGLFKPFVTVTEAKDGAEALEMIRTSAPNLILSDVNMPVMSGMELLAALKKDEQMSMIPIIMLTANSDEENRVQGLLAGAEDYMAKPFKGRELLARVNLQIQIGKKRRSLEKAFQERSAEYRIIADYAPIGIARASATGEIYFVNEEWFNMSQYEPRELPIKNWAPYIEPADLETLSTTWFGFLQSTDPDFKTCKFEWGWSRTGRRVSAVFARLDKVQPGSGLTGVIGCLTDITLDKIREKEQQERLVEERRRTQEALEAKRQQELLIDVTSHELRNPISAVLQCSLVVSQDIQQLRSDIIDHLGGMRVFTPNNETLKMLDECVDAMESVYQCGLSQTRIADDVLSLGKIQLDMLQIYPTQCNIQAEVAKVLSVFRLETLKLSIGLSHTIGPGIATKCPLILTDMVRLSQCIVNLCSNAIRFTQTSTIRKVHVHADLSPFEPSDGTCVMPETDWSTTFIGQQPFYLYIAVQDTGPGLTPESLSKLFKRFAQASQETHTVFGGSGLGLFVTRRIVELLHGRIEVSSTYGVGSTFRFYIRVGTPVPTISPVVAEVDPKTIPNARATGGIFDASRPVQLTPPLPGAIDRSGTLTPPVQMARSLRVAVVEDNVINNKVLYRQLTKAKHSVKTAFNGLEGLELIRGQDGKYGVFDVVLMDIEMPVMDGLTAIRTLRAEETEKGIPRNLCIALTGNARDAQKQMAMEAGFDDVVIKPYRLDALLQLLEAKVPKTAGISA